MRLDNMDSFELELQEELRPRPAPPGLKRRILERRNQQRVVEIRHRIVLWQRVAATFIFASVLYGTFAWHHHVHERRRSEEARQQVLTALEITHRALRDECAQMASSITEHISNDKGNIL